MAMIRMKFPQGVTTSAGKLDSENCVEVPEEMEAEWRRHGAIRVAQPGDATAGTRKARRADDDES
jgi:hypothetical protein